MSRGARAGRARRLLLAKYPDQLSGGERQRVAIARALAAEPSVLICDEVTSSLDVSVQATIIELLAKLIEETGVGMIFVTHHLPLVRNIAQEVAVMSEGNIVEYGLWATCWPTPRPSTRRGCSPTRRRSERRAGGVTPTARQSWPPGRGDVRHGVRSPNDGWSPKRDGWGPREPGLEAALRRSSCGHADAHARPFRRPPASSATCACRCVTA